ncbi:MAG: 16S rRNA (cytosine(1402)-N(4))-methyltransferase RsmH [Bacteroidales bacterium]|jgi:16S rRNA (cytosine1402-N4)-methyltransferase|nr:16S rRNA (cytosine(1402)-N(4))-methyltransferase RsmH [Bacteroidales bacterium]
MYHNPVMLKESVDGLNIKPGGVYVDVTFGGGGHSKAILDRMEGGRLIAFDQDSDALVNAFDDARFTLIHQNFKYLKNFLRLHQASKIDGLIADLGVSSHQFDIPERGFSTRYDGELDARMDKRNERTAATLINTYPLNDLARIFRLYGELKNAYRISKKIVEARTTAPINTVDELKACLAPHAPRHRENKFYAQVFQALRIEVNEELDALESLLKQSVEVLKPGGRLVFLSYHSLEDRLVKNFIKAGNFDGELEKDFYGNIISPLRSLTRKPLIASEDEIETNNRARSAKLRIAIKKDELK